jgi:hypothetical protein
LFTDIGEFGMVPDRKASKFGGIGKIHRKGHIGNPLATKLRMNPGAAIRLLAAPVNRLGGDEQAQRRKIRHQIRRGPLGIMEEVYMEVPGKTIETGMWP